MYMCVYKYTYNHILKTMYNCVPLDDINVPLQICFQSIHLEAFIESTLSHSADRNHTRQVLICYFKYSGFSIVPFLSSGFDFTQAI